jgi:hypothetical protein
VLPIPAGTSRTAGIPAILIVFLTAVLLPSSTLADPKTDPSTGRIRLLIIGESTPYEPYFVTMYGNDPRIDLRGVVTAGDYAEPKKTARFMRIFMPRTEARFLESLDVVELVDFVPWSIRDHHVEWIHKAVKDEGFGLTLCQMGWYPYLSHKYTSNDPEAWMATSLYDAYPVDMVLEKQNKPSVYHEIVEETPVVSMPGFEQFRLGGSHGLVSARPGAKVHTRWRTGKEDAICSIEYGQGIVLWYPNGWNTFPQALAREWKYFVDFVLNQAYFVADVPVPEDPELAHSLRSAFKLYMEHKSLVIGLIDFIDKFGANTDPLHRMIDGLEEKRTRAGERYLQGEYQQAWNMIHEAQEGLLEISAESTRLRRRALLWVYITEYIVVSATGILCGFAVWTLMVRRRYYREVRSTRLQAAPDREG